MKSVLIIEDDSFLINIYSVKMKEAGFSVDSAVNGEEALKKIQEKKQDIILLDIVLPGIDGWEVLEKIKKQNGLEDCKIIVLTNLGQKKEVEKGLSLGAVKYLIKAHYTPSEIVKEIEKIL